MASRLQDVILRGLSTAKPAATAVANGTLYYSTDLTVTEQSDGVNWNSYSDGGGIIGPPGIAQTSFLVQGGQVAWIANYDFTVSAADYYIQGALYSSPETNITLDAANPTNPRIDVIAVTDAGTVIKITGTAAANPSEPDVNPGTQLKLGLVLVPALSTQPVVSNTTVYFDNAGGPTEWNWAAVGAGFNVNSTNNPKAPSTKDIEGTAVTSGDYAQGDIPSSTFDPNSAELLIIYIRSKATWANNRGLAVTLRTAGVLQGQAVNINRVGTFGFDSATTGVYQQVAIPTSLFGVPAGQTITQVRITAFGSGHGFYLDDIKFQIGGASQTPVVAGINELTGDVTAGPGSGSVVATIGNDKVTFAKMQNISAASRLIGRGSAAGAGDPEEITLGAGLSMAGTVLSSSGGGGSSLVDRFSSEQNNPPTSNPAVFNTRGTIGLLDFDDTTQEGAVFKCICSPDYGGGNIEVFLTWAAKTATSGTIGWDVAFANIGDGAIDLDSIAFATAQTITATTVPGTSGFLLTTSVVVTAGSATDSLDAGDMFLLRVRRDVANDTATGDAQLLGGYLKEV